MSKKKSTKHKLIRFFKKLLSLERITTERSFYDDTITITKRYYFKSEEPWLTEVRRLNP